jgi:Flp pilus assembly pilin Flp
MASLACMTRCKALLRHFCADTRGATSIEYCLIAVLISIVCVGVWRSMGQNVSTMTATVVPGLTR